MVYVQEILDIMKICVVIPVYNEARTVGDLIARVKKLNLEVLAVDDGSKDDTFQVAKASGAVVLKNEFNLGKGASLLKGFKYALSNNFDAIITMDGDGQHDPADIPSFVRLAEVSESGILIGNRMLKTKNMPWIRMVTNKLLSRFISGVSGQRIPDTQCGFRLIKKDVLEKVNLSTNNFEAESELLIKAARSGVKIESVPINTIYMGEKSRINPFIDTFRFIRLIIKEAFKK